MTVEAFPLASTIVPGQRITVGGRDDAVVLYQRGGIIGFVAMDAWGRPFSDELPIEQVRLAFGKRAAAGCSARMAPPSREEGAALRQFADAMAGSDSRPCDA